jgi:hypothetical protein
LSWGIKDQYEGNGSEAADNTGNLILKIAFDLHNMMRPSIRMNGYRSWNLLEATGGPDDIYHGGVLQGIQTVKEAAAEIRTDQEIRR